MGTLYIRGDDAMAALLERVRLDHHVRLEGITVAILVAMAPVDEETGEPKGPALKHNGYPALAMTRKLPVKLRAHGLADAEIVLDGDRWGTLTDEEQIALLDHELTHLEPVTDDQGALVRDVLNRPKLRIRLHDYQHGWFTEVAQRHGAHSQEVQQARQLMDAAGQYYFDFDHAPRPRITTMGADAIKLTLADGSEAEISGPGIGRRAAGTA